METIEEINSRFNHMVDELFEKVLCDKCMKEIKIGQVDGEIILKNSEKIMLCKKCTEEIKKLFSQSMC